MPRRTLFAVPALAMAIAAMPSGALAKPVHHGAHAKGATVTTGKADSHRPAGTGGGRRIR